LRIHICLLEDTQEGIKLTLKPRTTQEITSSIKHSYYLFNIQRSKLLTDVGSCKQLRNHLTHVEELAQRNYYEGQFAQKTTETHNELGR